MKTFLTRSLFLVLLLCSSVVQAAELVVTTTSDTATNGICDAAGVNDGCTLREAITAANGAAGDDAITFDKTVFASPRKTITLNGTQLPIISSNLSITAPAPGVVIHANSQSRVFEINGAVNVEFSGLTLTDGEPLDFNHFYQGGAIYNDSGNLTISNCILNANDNAIDGGAIYNARGNVTINNSTLKDNIGAVQGGAIYNISGSLTINNSILSGNNAAGSGGAIYNSGTLTLSNSTLTGNSGGGGIYNSGNATITGCTLSGNTSNSDGGAIHNSSGSLTISNSILSGNDATQGGAIHNNGTLILSHSTLTGNSSSSANSGSGVYNNGGSVTIDNTSLSDNIGSAIYNRSSVATTITNSVLNRNSAFEGGAIYNSFGPLTISNSILSGNKAIQGGAIYSDEGTLTLSLSTLSDNQSSNSEGGGIFNLNAAVTITNSTLSGNRANTDGGAIYNIATALMTVTNSTLSGNSAPLVGGIYRNSGTLQISNTILQTGDEGTNLYSRDGFTSLGYNLSSDGAGDDPTTPENETYLNGPNDRINIDARLEPLADNGGPTPTHALQPRSPAINKGNSNLRTDQRGVTRPQGKAGDIGAYEAILVEINDVTVLEGNSDTKNAVFQVTLSSPLSHEVKVAYDFVNGSAKVGQDFHDAPADAAAFGAQDLTSGVLTVPAGQTNGTITVPVKGDSSEEGTEVFYVLLSSDSGLAFSKGRGVGTILDDDRAPAITIQDATIAEGNSGSRYALFTLNLSVASGYIVSVEFTTANGSAKAGSDYTPVISQTVRFGAGQTSVVARVPITGDEQVEADETFYVLLRNASNASISRGRAIGTIINDDASG